MNPETIRLFRHNGFSKLPTRLPAERVEALKAAIWRDIDAVREPVMRDRSGRVVRISRIWDREPLFADTLTAPEVLDPLEDLLGPRIELVRNRHNHATLRLRGDGMDYFHRDVAQWSRTIVTVLFYLEETTLENGCTWVVPGSHVLPGSEDETVDPALVAQALPVPMPAGGLLALDGTLVHSAGPNRTDGTRMSMTAGYISADELADADPERRVLVRGERRYRGNDRG